MKVFRTQNGSVASLSFLVNGETGNGVKGRNIFSPAQAHRSFMASVDTGAPTVTIQVSNDGVVWKDYISLTPTPGNSDAYADVCPWPFMQAMISNNAGSLTVSVGF